MIVNSLIHYLIVFLISLTVYQGRMKFIDGGDYE